MGDKVTFRFAEQNDYRYFADIVLGEKFEVQKHLGLLGFDEDYFKCTEWRAIFIAEITTDQNEKKRIGCISVSGGSSTGFNYIGITYIIPEYRRRGYGELMIYFANEYAKNTWNAGGIDLYTIENEGMDRLLQKMGFTNDGTEAKHYFLNGGFIGQKRWIKTYEY